MKKKLLAVAMVCVFALGIGMTGFEPSVAPIPGSNNYEFNGGPGSAPPPCIWNPPRIIPPQWR